jgi:hypothetical protein
LTLNDEILAGRSKELCVEIPIPADFAASTALKVSVAGIGDQAEYTAEAETEVIYGAYFVPTDIPSLNAVPNSNDCIIKVGVKNIGNASGVPELEYLNAIYATDDASEILKYKSVGNTAVSPNGETVVSFTMTDTHIGSGKYSTVQVHMGDKYDQSTEAPMPSPISLTLEKLTYNHSTSEIVDPSDDTDKASQNNFYIILAFICMVVFIVATIVLMILTLKISVKLKERR